MQRLPIISEPATGPVANRAPRRKAVVLVATMVVVILLSLAAYHFGDVSTAEFKASEVAQRQIQAKAIADSGIHFALAVLSNPTIMANTLYNNPYNQPSYFNDVPMPSTKGISGKFRLIAPPGYNMDGTFASNEQTIGVLDETGKINVSAFLYIDPSGQTLNNILLNLPSIYQNQNIANAIVDWIDNDDVPMPAGAESSTYSGMSQPYGCKNGALDSIEELLLVQGVTPQIFYGTDRNRNGILDANEGGGPLNLGLFGCLTTYSRELQVNAQGQPLVFLNDTNLANLNTNLTNASPAIDSDLAKFIVIYRQYGPSSSNGTGGTGGSGSPAQSGGGGKTSGGGGKTSGGGGKTSGGGGKTSGGGGMSGGASGTGGGAGGKNSSGSGGMATPPPAMPMPDTSPMADTTPAGVLANLVLNVASQTNVTSNQFTSFFQLVNAQVKVPASGDVKAAIYTSPIVDMNTAGTFLPQLYQNATLVQGTERPARVNVNTASPAVLTALFAAVAPNMTSSQLSALLTAQQTALATNGTGPSAAYQTPVWLYTQGGISLSTMQTIEQYITTTSQVFRVQSVGMLDDKDRTTARVEAVIDINGGMPRILMWRDLTELGRGVK